MPVVISDQTLEEAGMSEREVACRLYDIDKLSLWPAAKLAGMNRGDFEQA